MIKVVLFDVDGVILFGRKKYFSQRYSQEYGIPIETLNLFFQNEFQLCLVGKADLKEELMKHLKAWQWRGTLDELLEYWFSGEKDKNEAVLQVVENLQAAGVRCALATNQEKYRAQYLLDKVGLEKYFDQAFVSANLGHKKSEKEFFEKVLEELGFKPVEVLFWDNDEKNIEAAKSLGIKADFYKDFADFKQKMKNYFPSLW